MHVCMHACMYVSTVLCLLVRFPSRVCVCPPAMRQHTCLLSRGCISCMYVCWTLCMCASTALCLFVRYFPVARARMRCAEPRLLVMARMYLMHICVLDARYVRLRVSHARAMSARYSCSHYRSPFMNARSPISRCSTWLHLCLYVGKYLHA